jgi:hypothetical protein
MSLMDFCGAAFFAPPKIDRELIEILAAHRSKTKKPFVMFVNDNSLYRDTEYTGTNTSNHRPVTCK